MNRFRELRSLCNMSQKDLATKLGINQTAVSQWERGVTSPSANILTELCKVLGTTSDYLLGITDEKDVTYVWQDTEIMEAVKNGFPTHLQNLLEVIDICSDHDQKMVFDILVELRHILLVEDDASRAASLDLLQSTFALSTRFVDVCIRTRRDGEEGRIEKIKASCTKDYVEALSVSQQALLPNP